MPELKPLGVTVLISGRGSNLEALATAQDKIGIHILRVISNRPDAAGLKKAETAGIAATPMDHQEFSSREAFDAALSQNISQDRPELIILAGFMRILSHEFVERYIGRMINIHPSLLPRYPGLNTHGRALEAGDSSHGASIHFVTPQLDGGPVISQTRLNILPEDDPRTLAARLLPLEHRLMVATVELFAQRRVELRHETVYLDKKPLLQPIRIA